MKIRDKYPQLQDEQYVRTMVTRSVYGSMRLEAQSVPMARIEELYAEVRNERQATQSTIARTTVF